MLSIIAIILSLRLLEGSNLTITNQTGPINCTEDEDCYIKCLGCNGQNNDYFEINCPMNGHCTVDCIQCNDTIINCNGNSATNCTINCMSNPYYMPPENDDEDIDDSLLWGCYDSIFIGGKASNVSFNCYDSLTCGDSQFHCTNYSDSYINGDDDGVTKNTSCSIYCEDPFSCYDGTHFYGENAVNMSLMCIGDKSCYNTDYQCPYGGYNQSNCSMSCYGDYSCYDNDAKGNNAKYINFDCIGDYSCSDKNMYCSRDNSHSECNITCFGDYSCEYTTLEGMSCNSTLSRVFCILLCFFFLI